MGRRRECADRWEAVDDPGQASKSKPTAMIRNRSRIDVPGRSPRSASKQSHRTEHRHLYLRDTWHTQTHGLRGVGYTLAGFKRHIGSAP
jgi:hypothetical protein